MRRRSRPAEISDGTGAQLERSNLWIGNARGLSQNPARELEEALAPIGPPVRADDPAAAYRRS
jgi:hypothetical protein